MRIRLAIPPAARGSAGGTFRGGRRKGAAWCGCSEKPAEGEPAPGPKKREWASFIPGAPLYELDEIARITVTFGTPIRKRFRARLEPPSADD